jgi:carbonic anhydrase
MKWINILNRLRIGNERIVDLLNGEIPVNNLYLPLKYPFSRSSPPDGWPYKNPNWDYFKSDVFKKPVVNGTGKGFVELISGEQPHTIVLCCSDCEVNPEQAFDTGPGELLVLRVAGCIANTSTIASIEYTLINCRKEAQRYNEEFACIIVVLGHQNCEAVAAAIPGILPTAPVSISDDHGQNINHLLSHISPAVLASPSNASLDYVVKKHVELTMEELILKSTIIRDAVENEEFVTEIIPAFYNSESAKVDFLFPLHRDGTGTDDYYGDEFETHRDTGTSGAGYGEKPLGPPFGPDGDDE